YGLGCGFSICAIGESLRRYLYVRPVSLTLRLRPRLLRFLPAVPSSNRACAAGVLRDCRRPAEHQHERDARERAAGVQAALQGGSTSAQSTDDGLDVAQQRGRRVGAL
ncbi:unnamed protein product, partial [Prorocentrum cordatum]